MKTLLCATLALAAFVAPAHATDGDIDVGAFEYIDVVETNDGSIWKGVLVEQTPGVHYKIATAGGSVHVIKTGDVTKLSKQRNPQWRGGVAARNPTGGALDGGVGAKYEPGPSLPAPYATSGLRIDPEATFVFPQGLLSDAMVGTSFGTGVRVGYEALFGNFGLTGGFMARNTWWQLPGQTEDVAWTLETQLYGRAAMHIGRAAPYAGIALGLDTNYVYSELVDQSNTSVGFGMNLQGGLSIAATPQLAIDIGVDYHPGTDSINDMLPMNQSVEYFALHVGTTLRL